MSQQSKTAQPTWTTWLLTAVECPDCSALVPNHEESIRNHQEWHRTLTLGLRTIGKELLDGISGDEGAQ